MPSHPTPPTLPQARGLDAGERLAKRLVGLGDNRTAAIVRRIALEERAHVAVGERHLAPLPDRYDSWPARQPPHAPPQPRQVTHPACLARPALLPCSQA